MIQPITVTIMAMGILDSIRGKVRYRAREAYLAFPKTVACNVCGWSGRRFLSDSWHPHIVCFRCRSQVRHRLVVAALTHLDGLRWADLVDGKRVLHFAPEKVIAGQFHKRAGKYVTADYMRDGVDLKLDMCAMPEVADGSVDLLIACDILEHVPDVTAALRECHRTLSPGGCAIFTVPQIDGMAKTDEDPTVTTPEQRLRRFGQEDHLRIFGDDLPAWMESAGFAARTVEAATFEPDLVRRHVLRPPVPSQHPLATNNRKVYFGRKA